MEIKALMPELEEVYFDFFDNRAFSDGSPYYPCYCNAFNLSATEIREGLYRQAELYGGDTEGWKRALRESAVHMVREGKMKRRPIARGKDKLNLLCVLRFLPHIAVKVSRHSCLSGFVPMQIIR